MRHLNTPIAIRRQFTAKVARFFKRKVAAASSLALIAFLPTDSNESLYKYARLTPEHVQIVSTYALTDSTLKQRSLVIVFSGVCEYDESVSCVPGRNPAQDSIEALATAEAVVSKLEREKGHPPLDTVSSIYSKRALKLIRETAASRDTTERSRAFLLISPIKAEPQRSGMVRKHSLQVSTVSIIRGCDTCSAELDIVQLSWTPGNNHDRPARKDIVRKLQFQLSTNGTGIAVGVPASLERR